MNQALAIAIVVLGTSPIVASASDPAPMAEVMIRSDHSSNLWQFRTYKDGANCKGLSPPIQDSGWMEVKANEQFTFFVSGASSNEIFRYEYCWTNVTFTPQQGKKYVASFSFGEKTCGVSVIEVSDESSSSTAPVDFFLRAYKPPFLQNGSWCGKRIK